MSEAAVEVRSLSKKFIVRHERRPSVKRLFTRLLRPFPSNVLWALRGISLSIEPGQAVGLIGENGSGKSTLLRIVAGILRPTEGSVHVRGRAGGLFELAAGFHPELSGRDNIWLSGALMGYSPRQVAERFDTIVEFSEMADFIDIPVKSYSSGMALRVGFAIAVAFEPEVLLVDEVLAVADAHFQRKAYGHLRRLQERGTALIIVSHETAAIRGTCSRALWLDHGQLRRDGDTNEVLDEYLAYAERNNHG